jgi:succinate-acetate transporter protein
VIEALVIALIVVASIALILMAWAVFTLIVVVGAEKLILRLMPSRATTAVAEDPIVVDLR